MSAPAGGTGSCRRLRRHRNLCSCLNKSLLKEPILFNFSFLNSFVTDFN